MTSAFDDRTNEVRKFCQIPSFGNDFNLGATATLPAGKRIKTPSFTEGDPVQVFWSLY